VDITQWPVAIGYAPGPGQPGGTGELDAGAAGNDSAGTAGTRAWRSGGSQDSAPPDNIPGRT
jgi:hypothetical protein